jgi:hypothetical protein
VTILREVYVGCVCAKRSILFKDPKADIDIRSLSPRFAVKVIAALRVTLVSRSDVIYSRCWSRTSTQEGRPFSKIRSVSCSRFPFVPPIDHGCAVPRTLVPKR